MNRCMQLARSTFSAKAVCLAAIVSLAAAPVLAQTAPAVVSTSGYIQGNPLATHTTAPFNSVGAYTLVVFIGSHPSWLGLPVSISGVSDSQGNTWNLLTGPATWVGSSFSQIAAIYYVNMPATSAAQTVTVQLTNPAPLVMHVFAVSGSDVTGPPIYSPITNPGTDGTSATVTTAPITVPANSLLLAWAKNETDATATALDGFTLDTAQSTAFLWAEYQSDVAAGSYSGQFQYSTAIGWQTAIVGMKPLTGPAAFNQSVTATNNTPLGITLTAISPGGFPLLYTVVSGPANGILSGTAPNLTYTPNAGYAGSDAFTFLANDGTANSNVATVSITVLPPYQPPVASNSNVTVGAGSTTGITLNASDPQNYPLTYSIVTAPANGQLSSGTGANRTYTPNAGFLGTDSFTFLANDGVANSNVATVNLTVAVLPQVPAEVGSTGYLQGNPQTTHTTAAFNSVGASTLVAFVSGYPSWNGQPVSIGGLSDSAGNIWSVLTGPTTWAGSAFTQISAIYYVNAPATSAAHTVTVQLTNAAPLVMHVFAISGSDVTGPPIYSAITNPGTGQTSASVTTAPITVPVSSLLLSWVKNETGATATALDGYTLDAQSVSYLWAESQPAPSAGSYSGQFQYSAAIGWQAAIVGMRPATGPAAFNQSVTTALNTPANITLTAVSPEGFPLTYTVVTSPANGVLSGAAPNLTYTPNAGFSGSDSFTFQANDGTANSNIATVSITVLPPYQPPVASNSNVNVGAGSTTGITLNASDPQNYPLTYSIVTPPANGQISGGTSASRTYTPNAGFLGTDSFTFMVNDGVANSNVATVSITVAVLPQVPAEVGSVGYLQGNAQTTHTTAAFNSVGASTLVAFVSGYPSWNGQPVSISGLSDSAGNTWSVLTGPTTWAGSAFTQMSAIYYVNAPATSAAHTVTVQLTNAAPLVMHVFAISGSDVTGPPIYSAITNPGTGQTSASVTTAPITVPVSSLLLSWVKNETGATATALDGYTLDAQSVSYLWAESQPAPSAGSYSGQFQYSAAIGWQAAIVGMRPATGPAAFNQSVTTALNTPANITLTAVSPEGFPLTYTVVTSPANGVLSGAAPNLTYTPNAGYSGGDSFTFMANDGTANSNIATVSITVLPPYQPPVASNSSVTVGSGSTTGITLNASDPQNYPLTYSIVTPPANGQLSGGTGASRTYTPNPGYFGADSFTFMANDGIANSNVATVSITVVVLPQVPTEVGSTGYIQGNPQTTHTTAAFTSVGASTLVAFVSTYPTWNGQPVSIIGLSDNAGNNWNVLTGSTTWAGSVYTQISAIYYVNAPATSAAHTVTVQLTNGAPLVMHVFAISGSDVTGPPITSAITNPGTGQTSASVTTAPITVPVSSLLLSWVKNETGATATALGGYTLDAQSTSYLWAESQPASSANSYSGQFQYSAAIGWQAAIVGIKPVNQGPVASNGSVTTSEGMAVSGTLVATDTSGNPLTFSIVTNGAKGTAVVTNAATGAYTYTPNPSATGSDTFTFKANDGITDSNVATITVTITSTTPPPAPSIASAPANPTNQTGATFVFSDTQAGVSFLCQLDGNIFSTCTSPATYSGPLAQGSHTFAVEAQDASGNQSTPATFTWTINTTPPPAPSITSGPANPTNQTSATFLFSDTQSGVSFLCQLDGSILSTCTSPAAYSGPLAQGSHTFAVKAQDAAGNQSSATNFTWTINTTPPPAPSITSGPANPTNQTGATFVFSDTQSGVTFFCQLDGSALSACSSPAAYSGPLAQGSHTFAVKAQDTAGNQSSATNFTWTINTTPPPAPSITSGPSNPTSQTNATFVFSDTQAGVSFFCQLDGSAFSACSSPAAYSGPLAQGSHTFAVKAQDTAGNQSSASTFTWTIAAAPPAPALTSTPVSPTDQTSASFAFTDIQAGVTFLCKLDSGAAATCSSPATYTGPLAQGAHFFAVWARDAAGNTSTATKFTWTVNTTPPPTPSITSSPANPTNQTSATFGFSDSQGGLSFMCQLDGSAYAPCTSPVTYAGPLAQGSHTFSVEGRNTAGDVSAAASVTWTIDTTPPPTPMFTSTPANPTSQTSASFAFSDSQTGVSFLCKLDTAAFAACTSPVTYAGPLAQGSHSFSILAKDSAGNSSTAATFTWTINTTAPPTPTITSSPANPTDQTSATFRFTDTQGGLTFMCQLDGSAYAACTSPATYAGPLTSANHTFSVLAQNTAGLQSAAASVTWTIDTTPPPAPTFTATPAKNTNQTSASFTFSDSQTGVSFLCKLDTGTFGICTSPVAYAGPLAQGSHSFSAVAKDPAGNLSTATTYSWTIDTTPPPAPTITSSPSNPAFQTSATFKFSDTQSGVSFLCQLDGSALSACTNPKTYSGLSLGSHTFAVKAQDAAGNQSTATTYTWTVL